MSFTAVVRRAGGELVVVAPHRCTLRHDGLVAPLVPIGLGLGRLGNFINGELRGKPTALAWGMIFPNARADDLAYVDSHPALLPQLQQFGGLTRHPSSQARWRSKVQSCLS